MLPFLQVRRKGSKKTLLEETCTRVPTHIHTKYTPKKSGFPGIDPLFSHQSSSRYPLNDKQNTALASERENEG